MQTFNEVAATGDDRARINGVPHVGIVHFVIAGKDVTSVSPVDGAILLQADGTAIGFTEINSDYSEDDAQFLEQLGFGWHEPSPDDSNHKTRHPEVTFTPEGMDQLSSTLAKAFREQTQPDSTDSNDQ